VVFSPLARRSGERLSACKMPGSRSGSTTTKERRGKIIGRDTPPPARLASRIEPNCSVVRSLKSALVTLEPEETVARRFIVERSDLDHCDIVLDQIGLPLSRWETDHRQCHVRCSFLAI